MCKHNHRPWSRICAAAFMLICSVLFLGAPGAKADVFESGGNRVAVAALGSESGAEKPKSINLFSSWLLADELPYTDALKLIDGSSYNVESIRVVTSSGLSTDVLIVMKSEDKLFKAKFPGQDAADRLVNLAESRGIVVQAIDRSQVVRTPSPQAGEPSSNNGSGSGWFTAFGPTILLLVGMGAIMYYFYRRQAGGGGGANSRMNGIGDSGARKFTPDGDKKTFVDVAGQDEAKEELAELVQFLKERTLLNLLGGKPAKGALLVGPPGTGKTLLAKAVAGEAGADFYSISGSNFVQMFVGVGAARVRDLFKQASTSKSAIIFIDEIDAVGRERGTGLGGGNDEREQTLNQLLAEMDGFGSRSNIIVLAATNRPDVLDPALTRPGRFDMQVLVDNPDLHGRLEILKVHTRKKKLAAGVDLDLVAKNTTGFSGAQLEGVADQAAIVAFRRLMATAKDLTSQGMTDEDIRKQVPVEITMEDFDEGIDRVMMGPKNASRGSRMSRQDKENTAVHEVGHAWMANLTYKAGYTRDPVTKITIVPRARALGYMVAQPESDTYSHPREYLISRIMIALGGRVAQEVFFGVSDGGAQNDFEQAWNIANRMVTKFGMSRLGIISIGQSSNPFLGKSMAMGGSSASPDLQNQIEAEVRRIIDECYRDTYRVIERDKELMQPVIDLLLEKETVLGPEFNELVNS